jgi:hypothetical protein
MLGTGPRNELFMAMVTIRPGDYYERFGLVRKVPKELFCCQT